MTVTYGHIVAVITKALPDQVKAVCLAFIARAVHRCRHTYTVSLIPWPGAIVQHSAAELH